MNIKVPNTNQIPPIDTSSMYNLKKVKIEELHKAHQEKVNEYYKVKKEDIETRASNMLPVICMSNGMTPRKTKSSGSSVVTTNSSKCLALKIRLLAMSTEFICTP